MRYVAYGHADLYHQAAHPLCLGVVVGHQAISLMSFVLIDLNVSFATFACLL